MTAIDGGVSGNTSTSGGGGVVIVVVVSSSNPAIYILELSQSNSDHNQRKMSPMVVECKSEPRHLRNPPVAVATVGCSKFQERFEDI
jgi:hypothetical protein